MTALEPLSHAGRPGPVKARTSDRPTTGFPVSRLPAVNVAQVPQRSPLRYPGGKTWLIPHIRHWLRETHPQTLIEPFAGGGIVSLTAVSEDLVETAVMIEKDRDVAAFWRCALSGTNDLQERIRGFVPTRDSVREIEEQSCDTPEDHGWRTLVLNRTRRGGVLAHGASFTRKGENGKGLASRWYADTLIARLDAIDNISARITFTEGDAMTLLPDLITDGVALFVDPPYTAQGGKKAGTRLYRWSDIDHAALFALLAETGCNFLGHYEIRRPENVARGQLRPLRDPNSAWEF